MDRNEYFKQRYEEQQKMRALLNAIEMPEKPKTPAKSGHKWELKYKWGDSGFKYEEVEDTKRGGKHHGN